MVTISILGTTAVNMKGGSTYHRIYDFNMTIKMVVEI